MSRNAHNNKNGKVTKFCIAIDFANVAILANLYFDRSFMTMKVSDSTVLPFTLEIILRRYHNLEIIPSFNELNEFAKIQKVSDESLG